MVHVAYYLILLADNNLGLHEISEAASVIYEHAA